MEKIKKLRGSSGTEDSAPPAALPKKPSAKGRKLLVLGGKILNNDALDAFVDGLAG